MKYRLTALLISLLLLSCTQDPQEKSDSLKFVPKNTSYLLQSPNTSKFFKELDSTQFFLKNIFPDTSAFAHIINLTELADIEKSLICFVPKEEGGFDYLLISNQEPILKIDSIKNKSLETLKFQDYEIKKLTTEGFTTFSSKAGETYLASTSLDFLKKAIAAEEDKIESPAFDMVYAAADKKKTSLFINHTTLDDQLSRIFTTLKLPIKTLASWTVVDMEIEGDDFLFNGVVTSKDGSPEILNLFEGVTAQKNEFSQITPSSAAGFFSFTYENFENLHKNLNNFRNDSLQLSPNHLLNFTREAGIIYGDQDVFALSTTDPELAMESIETKATIPFRGVNIEETSDPDQFSRYLSPLIKTDGLKFYASVENFMIFSGSVKALENIITNYQNNTTLEKQDNYGEAVTNLASSSSFLIIANTSSVKNRLENNISKEFEEDLENLEIGSYSIAALQLVKDQNFAHLHGILKTSQGKTSEGIQQLASIKLNSKIGIPPHLVQNPRKDGLEVMVQDEGNILYLYNANGDLQWKKEFPTRITGEIFQVDLSKNGNLQYVFTTPNALHVLDRNGKPAKGFPVEFDDEITQPVSVFDYDNNRNYRFVITQKNDLLMYDSRGKLVRGFNFKNTKSQILQSPKHIRLKNKDYIVFPEESGKINILDRQGNSRVSIKEKIEASDNEWYEHKGNFVSVDSAGQLVFVDENGNVQKRGGASEANLRISATEKILASISENILKINDKEITLDFGFYTAPKIFQLKEKSYITVTDTEAQRLLVFNENAELLSGFPVYGNSSADMALDQNNNILISVEGEDNSVVIYSMK